MSEQLGKLTSIYDHMKANEKAAVAQRLEGHGIDISGITELATAFGKKMSTFVEPEHRTVEIDVYDEHATAHRHIKESPQQKKALLQHLVGIFAEELIYNKDDFFAHVEAGSFLTHTFHLGSYSATGTELMQRVLGTTEPFTEKDYERFAELIWNGNGHLLREAHP